MSRAQKLQLEALFGQGMWATIELIQLYLGEFIWEMVFKCMILLFYYDMIV